MKTLNRIPGCAFAFILIFLITDTPGSCQESKTNRPDFSQDVISSPDKDSLPKGIDEEWLKNFRDQSRNKIYGEKILRRGEHEGDAMQQRILEGQTAGENYGNSISEAGDVNGDGYGDIIIGAHAYNSYTGRAYIHYGGENISTTPNVTLSGEATSNFFGFSVSRAGDVNGDGYSDVIVGAFGYNSFTGRAYIFYGGASMNNIADVILTGPAPGSNFGSAVSSAGNVNGDSYPDVIVGSEIYNSSTGRAYIYFGGSAMNNVVDVTLTGAATFNYFGISVSDAGDVNKDNYSDVIVGASGYSNNTGRAYIFYGGASMNSVADVTLTGGTAEDYFATSVSGAGDVNGDGYSDVIAGAHGYNTNTGRAYIYYGGASMNNAADVILTGETTVTVFGYSVSGAGDLNGDSYQDVVVGAYSYNSSTGKAYIYYGGTGMNNFADFEFEGESTFNRFGASVSSAGDINGDSFSDVIVGAWGYNSSAGRVYIYTNTITGEDIPDIVVTGETVDNDFGWCVSSAGDVNNDGYSDVIVGADKYNSYTGRAYIFYGGPVMNNIADVTITGEAAYTSFGYSVSGVGDLNGDGYDDVIVGANGYNLYTGRAYIFFGGLSMNNTADVIVTGDSVYTNFAVSVSGAGDVNSDGYSDVIVGASGSNFSTGKAYIYLGGSMMNNVVDVTLTGGATYSYFGESVSKAGDVNADGYSDVVIGAYGFTNYTGRAFVFYGGAPMNNAADVTLTGESTQNHFGGCVSTAGDLNGDGFDDVIAGAGFYNSEKGKAYIYYGGVPMNNSADVTMTGDSASILGGSVSNAGDINGDGYSDVVVGAEGNYPSRAYIYFGGAVMNNVADIYMNGEGGNGFGFAVSDAGDLNNDGSSDMIVGAYKYNSNTGKVYIYKSSPPERDPYGHLTVSIIMEGFYSSAANNMRASDTVRVYLASQVSPYSISDSSKGIINQNTLTGTFSIKNAPTGNYYVVVKHRNCIQTWSHVPVNYIAGDTAKFTFIPSAANAFGNNLKRVDLSPQRYGIYSGDVNKDGTIDAGDMILIYNHVINFVSGYVVTDVSGDDFVDASDLIITNNNAINFVSVIRP